MRGHDKQQSDMFSYLSPEHRVRKDHPLRAIRTMVDQALGNMSGRFDVMYSTIGRPSIAPEKLLRAQLIQMLYSVRSERLLMEEIDYSVLFRWFVGMNMDEPVWDVTVFTKNRERLLGGEVSQRFFERVVEQARAAKLLEDEHFTVDGSLIEAWASRSSFEKKKDPPRRGTGARGRKMFRDTHESKSDPEARIYHKSRWTPGRPSYLGHVVTEDKHGLIVASCVTEAIKRAEREAGLTMMGQIASRDRPVTLAADRNYQERTFIAGLRQLGVIPLIAEYRPSKNWPNWLLDSEREHPRYARALQRRRRIEKVFSWLKGVAGLRRTRFRGRRRVDWMFRLAAAAHNLVRMVKLIPAV